MKNLICLATFTLLVMTLITGCTDADQEHPATVAVSFEGTFVQTDNPDLFLTVQEGRFKQGGKDVNVSGSYHAHQMTTTAYQLHVTYEGKFEGASETLTFRKLGDEYILKSTEDGTETRFKRTD